ncbi:MAG TPA: sialidase family protein [Polyangia bacterium]|jgi:MYXO-CTERM domain-containing protein
MSAISPPGRRHRPVGGAACRTLGALVVGLAVACAAARAHANGAFPDALQILLPTQKPQQIILGTNFGFVISDDGGKTWEWSCEQMASTNGSLYQLGPPPLERIYAVSQFGLIYSDNASCTWTSGAGALTTVLANDVFPEQAGTRVWAVARPIGMSAHPGVYLSTDNGQTFGTTPVYEDPFAGELTGVEVAASDPQTVYVALYEVQTCAAGDGGDPLDAGTDDAGDASALCTLPRLVHSSDGGGHWDAPIDLVPALGQGIARIVAVDPKNPQRIFLRFTSFTSPVDVLAVSDDAGITFRTPVSVTGSLTAFLRRADGTILVSGLTDGGPVGFRSSDSGATFTPWTGIPNLRALAERDGRIYGAADWVKDHYALGVSTDGGATFTPVVTFSQVSSVRACVKTLCQDPCDYQAGVGLWPPETCNPSTAKKTGCGCAAGAGDPGQVAWPWPVLAIVLAAAVLRRRRRGR